MNNDELEFLQDNMKGNPFQNQKQGAKSVMEGLLKTQVDSVINGFKNDPNWDQISEKEKEEITINAYQKVITERRRTLKKRYKK